MKKENLKSGFFNRGINRNFYSILFLRIRFPVMFIALAVFCLSALYAQRDPINVNIIIDSSSSLSNVKEGVGSWLSSRLDELLVAGDRVTIWSAAAQARVIYSGTVSGAEEKEAVKSAVRDIVPSGYTSDLSGALREAASRQGAGGYSYTLLISVSADSLSSLITGPNGNLLRYSRVEDFSSWRALVVGLNIDSRVRTSAAAFLNN